MSMTHIELLPEVEYRILKVIRVEGSDWNPFTAYLPYTRAFDPAKYDRDKGYDKGDELDAALLSVVQELYPRSILRYNQTILFKGELERGLNAIRGGVTKPVAVTFLPLIPYDELRYYAGKSLPSGQLDLTLRIHLGPKNERLEYIYSDFICYLPPGQLEKFLPTIRAV